ncbi:hypothetical protein DDB_G0285477 [Dictyostelium discoideum AX4]|uniref:UPF0521 protein A n=1 Tax=Dictyostelium discoideum TaxID=44689 RepID=U521A_DICDI|nr:hypothetical protein DDB_G0285477 [Dictyostelium discoideum AX4]Q54N65.1 RecName: Full=UPF0521 protein A [Dictyostelium discoideum]EAL64576.1 hypothetical protein DDB_G0285477 [Dictyostelium discoideum AX4]|eukprot:XP_638078.1 hypothetical protein DDB_G0285477 [Dictyostelium discoideum AX4]
MSLKEVITSLKNDFHSINKEIDSMKENNEKQEDKIFQEIKKLKLEMELLRKDNLSFKTTIQSLSDSINSLSSVESTYDSDLYYDDDEYSTIYL